MPGSIYEKSVFVNCPFDSEFEPLLHAIVLTIEARGFTGRSALETGGNADNRMDRIARGLLESKYSIHDLSRFKGEGAEHLARFNMPLELGMSLGIRYLRNIEYGASLKQHNWLVLVESDFVHQKFISDLNGFDSVDVHKGDPLEVIVGVAAWLKQQPDFKPPVPSANDIRGEYPNFREMLKKIKTEEHRLVWRDIIETAHAVVGLMPLPEP